MPHEMIEFNFNGFDYQYVGPTVELDTSHQRNHIGTSNEKCVQSYGGTTLIKVKFKDIWQ